MCVGVCGWVCVCVWWVCGCTSGGGGVGGVCVWVVCTSWKVKGLIPHGQRRISVDEYAAVISAETKSHAYLSGCINLCFSLLSDL